MANNVMIAPVGDNIDALFVGIKEFPTDRVVLITPPDQKENAKKAEKDLKRFQIPTQRKEIGSDLWEGMFQAVGEIKKAEEERTDEDDQKDIIINVSTGDKIMSCIAVSAAFVNGLKAMGVRNGEPMLLPVLKFSYYKQLTDKKMNILKLIFKEEDCCSSLEQLSEKTGMSLPLISYHVNGNLKSDGLKDLGLVDTVEQDGKTAIQLSTLGRMLVKGYV